MPITATRIGTALLAACAKNKPTVAALEAAGVRREQLWRFQKGERSLALRTAEQLADALGLEIVLQPKRRAKGGR